jgi:hypothetical protein
LKSTTCSPRGLVKVPMFSGWGSPITATADEPGVMKRLGSGGFNPALPRK